MLTDVFDNCCGNLAQDRKIMQPLEALQQREKTKLVALPTGFGPRQCEFFFSGGEKAAQFLSCEVTIESRICGPLDRWHALLLIAGEVLSAYPIIRRMMPGSTTSTQPPIRR